jgi:preprotein translocase SecF subunit
MIQWFKEPKIDFMKVRRFFMALSGLGMLAGLYACFLMAQGKANMGTDFSAGALLRISASQSMDIDPIRESLKNGGFPGVQIQQVTGVGETGFNIIIKLKNNPQTAVGSTGDAVLAVLNKDFPAAQFVLQGSDEVGPAVSAKLRDDAFKAFVFAMIGILAYIIWRFDFHFGVAAILTTVHDILIILAIVVLSGREFNLLQVTALLTLAGYSLNDTVVTFDRIRENLKLLVQDHDFVSLVNLSVNETLSRTINTSGTVFLTLLPLCIMGGDILKDFAFTLLLGVIVGTYSSIFVASPILVEWNLITKPKASQP